MCPSRLSVEKEISSLHTSHTTSQRHTINQVMEGWKNRTVQIESVYLRTLWAVRGVADLCVCVCVCVLCVFHDFVSFSCRNHLSLGHTMPARTERCQIITCKTQTLEFLASDGLLCICGMGVEDHSGLVTPSSWWCRFSASSICFVAGLSDATWLNAALLCPGWMCSQDMCLASASPKLFGNKCMCVCLCLWIVFVCVFVCVSLWLSISVIEVW